MVTRTEKLGEACRVLRHPAEMFHQELVFMCLVFHMLLVSFNA